MDLLITCFLLVGIAVFIYLGYVAAKLSSRFNKTLDFANDTIKSKSKSYDHQMKKVSDVLDKSKEYMEMPPAQHLMDAFMGFMSFIGAQDLGKNGLGLDKAQAGRVVMARNGFNVAGKRVGEGIGVPQLIEKADQFAPLVGAGGGGGGGIGGMLGGIGGGGEEGGGPNLIQMGIQFLMGSGGPGGGPPGKPPNPGGGSW